MQICLDEYGNRIEDHDVRRQVTGKLPANKNPRTNPGL